MDRTVIEQMDTMMKTKRCILDNNGSTLAGNIEDPLETAFTLSLTGLYRLV
ncbi:MULTISPECIES: hypothetical protein [Paenibacillus]|uniref:hypothetical protein n=1 Tax=Paenibacillus TaxID=44249 RepID=UPI000A9C9B7C|nr:MULTISPECIES: hypothetical protein [Paenibacillus]